MKRYAQSAGLFGLIGMVLAVLSGCSSEQAAPPPPPAPPKVTVNIPLQRPVKKIAEFSGITRAAKSVDIRARVEGTLEKVHFTAGTIVKKGQLLYTIDPRPFEAGLKEAEAELAIRRAELKLAGATAGRRDKAFRDKAVSEVAVIEAKADLAAATAAVARAEARVDRAELELSYTRITAPIDGRIARTLVDEGNLLEGGEHVVLTTIIQVDPIYAYFTVSEKELTGLGPLPTNGTVSEQDSVVLQLSDKEQHPSVGRIDYVDTAMDEDTGTLQVRAVIPNGDYALLPGLFARVRVSLGEPVDALLVPDSALGRDRQGHYLLTADTDNIVERKPVKIGAEMNGMRVISQGISPEDRVIVNGLQKARPGAPVSPIESEPTVAETASGSPSA